VRFAVKGNLDLAAVAPLVAPQNTKLAGRAAVDVRGSGRAKDPGSLALDGDATLTGVSVESPKTAKPHR
jgi:autotransporter translocation and assembly factor TamB